MSEVKVSGTAFLFTWKPDKWPYEELRVLIDDFEAGHVVDELWRCQADQMIRPGDRAYLLKQGDPPRGIFAVAEVTGRAEERADAKEGEARYAVPLRFRVLLDPKERFLVSESELPKLPVPAHRWNTQASGVRLGEEAVRIIDEIAAREIPASSIPYTHDGFGLPPGKRERLSEVYDRDQILVNELKRIYGNHCQICDSNLFNGHFGIIVEGHHIEWLCRGGADSRDNLILLCPNHHAAIHASDPTFDWAKLEFRCKTKSLPVRLNHHLKSA